MRILIGLCVALAVTASAAQKGNANIPIAAPQAGDSKLPGYKFLSRV